MYAMCQNVNSCKLQSSNVKKSKAQCKFLAPYSLRKSNRLQQTINQQNRDMVKATKDLLLHAVHCAYELNMLNTTH